jgi:hypothetical protein
VQKWDDLIREQLNNLPGFPPAPTEVPPAPGEWVLGDWIEECHVRPEVANFASLPLVDNELGDVRVSLADQAWYIWDGAVWQPMAGGGGGVASVGAVAPIASTGGVNPVISLNNSGVVAATYGNATNVPQIAVDAKGLITSASNVAISIPSVNVGLGNIAVGDGTGITGSTDLSFVSNVLEVNSQVNVTNGGNTLTLQPASIGSDAATLTVDAGTTVQVGGVAVVNISGAYTLPGVDGTNGQVLTTDGAGTASWQSVGGGGTITGSGTVTQIAFFTGATAIGSEVALGSDSFTWDLGNNRLGVTTSAPVASVDVASGQLAIADGSAAIPSLAFRDDLNTGLFSPSNDIVGVVVNAAEVARFQQSGGEPALLMGTTAPLGAITVDATVAVDGNTVVALVAHSDAGTAIQESLKGGQFGGVRTRGTKGAPAQVGADDGLLNVIGVGYTATGGYNYGALVTMKAEQAYTSTASGGRIEFHTTTNGTDGVAVLGGSTTERMRITNAGNVGVGTTAPTSTFSVGAGASETFRVDGATGRIVEYENAAPLNGDLMIGSTGVGFVKNAITAGAGISVTNGAGSITIAATGAAASTSIDIASTAQEALNAGDLVCFVNDAGTPKVRKADATNTDARLNPVGFATAAALAGAAVTVRVAGVADVPAALFDAAPAVGDVGKRVFASTTSGQITLTAPSASGDLVQRVGVLTDGSGSPKVLVQIGDPILL